MTQKVLVIGLDGATWDLIEPWANKGELPTFKDLMNNSTWGYLESTIPPVTSPAWPSFMTGKNPGKHAVFSFLEMKRSYDVQKDILSEEDINNLKQWRPSISHEYTREQKINFSNSIKSRKIWQILSDANKKVIVINVPVTYPPEKVNGILISGMLTPPGKTCSYPPELSKILKEMGYVIDINWRMFKNKIDAVAINNIMEKRLEIAKFLMLKYEWDFFMVVFAGPDRMQHNFWHDKKSLLEHYKKIDITLNQILSDVDENTYVLLMSDHGFGKVHGRIHINKWLEKRNCLTISELNNEHSEYNKHWTQIYYSPKGDKSNKKSQKLFSKIGVTKSSILKVTDRLRLTKLVKTLPKCLKNKIGGIIPSSNLYVDWSKTKAYFVGIESQGININLEGREPHGVVTKGDYDALRNYIIEELIKLKNPKTGEKLIDKIYKKEEIYSGPYVDKAPDILFVTKEEKYLGDKDLNTNDIFSVSPNSDSWHRSNGIFLAYGPDIKKGSKIKNAKIYDLAPTTLHIFGLPIPNDMDGRVLKEIFEDDSEPAMGETMYQEVADKEKIRKKIKELKNLDKL